MFYAMAEIVVSGEAKHHKRLWLDEKASDLRSY